MRYLIISPRQFLTQFFFQIFSDFIRGKINKMSKKQFATYYIAKYNDYKTRQEHQHFKGLDLGGGDLYKPCDLWDEEQIFKGHG